LEAYLTPQSDRAAVMNELTRLFDGLRQREAPALDSEEANNAGEELTLDNAYNLRQKNPVREEI